MGNSKKLIEFFLPLLLVVTQTSALECSCEGYFCVSDKEYALCQAGQVAGDPIPCGEGIICRNETGNECSRQRMCQDRQNSPNEENSLVYVKKFCQDEPFYPDPDNCQQFYLCSGFGVGKLMFCPTDTYYNEKTFTCTTYRPERCGSTNDPVTDGTDKYTTDAPLENENAFECPGIGLFADPQNCRQYYRCDEKNRSYLKNCAEGTYFDEKVERCATSIPERCRGLEPQLPNNGEELTTDDNISTTQTSQTNQDDTGKTTIYPEDEEGNTSQTTDNVITTQQTTDNIEEIRTTRMDDTEGNTDGTITSTLSPPTYEGSFVCPGEGYYPDPDDCHHYYVCDFVDPPMRVSCPEGTYYDDEYCRSDMPERCRDAGTPSYTSTTVKNDENSKTEKLSTKIPYDSEYQTVEGMTPTTASTPSQFVCPGAGIFPDPEYCHRYYICNGIDHALSLACPNGTYYDGETTFCSSDKPKRCEEPGYTSDEVTTASTAQTTKGETDGEKMEITTTERTTITTRNPEDGFECPGEGYFPDMKNCRKYFVCFYSGDSYIAIPVMCPGNTYFDEETEFCTDELPERCSEQYGHSSTMSPNHNTFTCPGDGYYADPNDCTLYYMCYGDSATHLTCPNGTYFNEENDFCTEEVPERCRDSNDNTHRPTIPTYTERPTTDKDNNGFTCPGVGYYPDPEKCQYYYVCYNSGTAIPVSCPPNTYFHEKSTFCMKELPERCRVHPEDQVTTTPPTPTKEEFTCSGDGYYPDPKDCQNYYICFGENQVIQLSCPNNTFYDEESSFCRNSIPDRCRATGEPTEDSAHTTTTPIYERNITSTTSAPTKDEFFCPEEGYYPHPKDCHRYYACYGFGAPLMLTCPEHTYFDEKGFCTLERPGRCSPEEPEYSTKPPQQQNTENEFKCSESGLFPDSKSCRKYWVCHSKNFGYSVQCPNDTYYHQDSTYCTKDKPESCKNEDDEDFRCPDEGYFADPSDCQTYHICYTRDVSIPMRCPSNSYYHQSLKGCAPDVPETCKNEDNGKKFVCPRAGYFPDPRDCSRYYVCNFWGDAFLAKCPQGRYFNERIRGCSSDIPPRCRSLTPPLQNGFICYNMGYFPDPVNCNVYHVCNIYGLHYTSSCPRDTYYHEDTRTCSPIIPERCVHLASETSVPDTPTNREEMSILSDTGYPLNNTFVCPDKGLFPDPYDCQKFYVCYGQPRQVTCWGKTYYSEKTQQCEDQMPDRCKAVEDHTVTPQSDVPASTPQPEEFLCPGNGLFPHPTDCRRFYVCYGQMRLVTCREGMYYNEETQQCGEEIPDRCEAGQDNGVTRPPSPPSTNPGEEEFTCPDKGLFPDPQNCHGFYVCYGQPRLVICRDGMYFNDETKQCGMEMPERCKSNSDGDVTQPSTAPPNTSQPPEFVCPDNGLYPDPYDCRRFYVCYGPPRQVTCREGMYFNDDTLQCDEKMPERCRTNGDGELTPQPTTPPSQPGEFICPDHGLFAHPSNCHKFYVCYGETREVTCWGDTYYDEETQKCVDDMPERCKSNSGDDVTPLPTVHWNTSRPAEFECPDNGLFPDPEDCQKFYVCYGEKRHVTCRDGMYYHEEKQECSEELPDRCKTNDDAPMSTTETPTTPSEIFKCQNPGRYPDPLDCQRFYFCNWQQEAFHFNCKDSTYFNDVTSKCEPHIPDRCKSEDDQDTVTTARSPPAFVCSEAGRFPDPENCLNYYYCSDDNSIPILYSCPTNEFFNAGKGKCKKIKTGYECPAGNPDGVHSHDEDSDEDDEDFECTQPGLFPDQRDCKKFYECSFSLKVKHKTCGGRTYFNEIFRHCSIFTTQRCKKFGFFW